MNLRDRLEQVQHLDDDALLHDLKRFVGSSNHLTALVLAHLAEVDVRRAYRKWACDTLVTYCVYELRLSEDEAQRRCRAARIARQFPVLFEMLEDASIHLTGILMLAPYLTDENHREVLARARYRRKSELQRLVAALAPSHAVPSLIEPLGSGRTATHVVPRNGWGAMHEALMGGVRKLVPGDGPAHAPSAPEEWRTELLEEIDQKAILPARIRVNDMPEAAVLAQSQVVEPGSALARAVSNGATRYKVQFTADQDYVDLVDRARALGWHQLRSGDLAELHRLAMQALVEKLLRRKCATRDSTAPARPDSTAPARPDSTAPARPDSTAPARPDSTAPARPDSTAPARPDSTAPARPDSTAPARPDSTAPARPDSTAPARPDSTAPARPDSTAPARPDSTAPARPDSTAPARRRHLPAELRRLVWERDGGHCTFVDERGVRCGATAAIEFHHEEPHARGGPDTVANIHLRCRAHNDFAAEGDFGRSFMQRKRRGHAVDAGA